MMQNGQQPDVNGTGSYKSSAHMPSGNTPLLDDNSDGAQVEEEPQPLHIIICGGGIGGLTAANFFRQAGHHATVLEQWSGMNEAGAAIMLPPTASSLFRQIGFFPEKLGANYYRTQTVYAPDGKISRKQDMSGPPGGWKAPYLIMHRSNLHAELRESAERKDQPGKPATIRLSSRVVKVSPEDGTVTLASGECLRADVIVGADGLSSVCRNFIPGCEDIKPFSVGKSAFRFLMPRKVAQADEHARQFAETNGHSMIWLGGDRRIAMYPCSNDELLNFVCVQPDAESAIDSDDEQWSAEGNKKAMLEAYTHWNNSDLISLLSLADPQTVRVWQIKDMEKLPTIVSGKQALIGDAARPIQPYYSQGGAQAVEDAASLAALLPLGTKPYEVPDRLLLYEKCRYERGHYVQAFVRRVGLDDIQPTPQEVGMFMKTVLSHDEWEASSKKLQEALEAR